MIDQARSVTVRSAKREDMPAIASLAAEFHAFLASIDDSDPAFDIESAASKLDRSGFGSRPLFSSLVAETGNDLIGYAIYNIGFWAGALEGMVLLTDLFVSEAWQGQGVGRQLMHRLAEIGRTEGCERVMWTVWPKNDDAMQFYDGLGATAIEDELLMSWAI